VRARADVDTAVRVLARSGLAPAASAALRSLDAELLTELALTGRQPALLDSAQARLAESSGAFPATTLPRDAALGWVRQAMLARARLELLGDTAQLEVATQALDRAGTLSEAASDSLLLTRIQLERRAMAPNPPSGPGRTHG
jgi:hypothetical protein